MGVGGNLFPSTANRSFLICDRLHKILTSSSILRPPPDPALEFLADAHLLLLLRLPLFLHLTMDDCSGSLHDAEQILSSLHSDCDTLEDKEVEASFAKLEAEVEKVLGLGQELLNQKYDHDASRFDGCIVGQIARDSTNKRGVMGYLEVATQVESVELAKED